MARVQTTEVAYGDHLDFLRTLQLSSIGLVACEWRVNRERYSQTAGVRLATKYRLTRLRADGFTLLGTLRIYSPTSPKSAALYLNATFELVFVCCNRCTREQVEQFARSELRLVVWPHYREFVASICARANIPSILIPLARTGPIAQPTE